VPGVLRCAIGTIQSNTECASTVYARIPFVRLRGLESQDLPLEAAMVCALVVTMAWVRRRKTVSCRDSLHNHLRLHSPLYAIKTSLALIHAEGPDRTWKIGLHHRKT
jgi:hypothetical protein